jgi:hypothetical protein
MLENPKRQGSGSEKGPLVRASAWYVGHEIRSRILNRWKFSCLAP